MRYAIKTVAVLGLLIWANGALGARITTVVEPPILPVDLVEHHWETIDPDAPTGTLHYVRPSEPRELLPNPFPWVLHSPFDPAPPSPAQETIRLTNDTPLTIVARSFGYRPMDGRFETTYRRDGERLELNSYFVWGGGATDTLYGPQDYLQPIGTLPVGTYNLTVRSFFLDDFEGETFSDANYRLFQENPALYAAARELSMGSSEWELSFTVVPEPDSVVLALVAAGAVAGAAVQKRRRGYSSPMRERGILVHPVSSWEEKCG